MPYTLLINKEKLRNFLYENILTIINYNGNEGGA